MHFLSLLTVTAFAALTSAAPSATAGNGLETRQECPGGDWYLCTGPRRSACLGSGLEICQETGCGGPCFACDQYCKELAATQCEELGCVRPDSK